MKFPLIKPKKASRWLKFKSYGNTCGHFSWLGIQEHNPSLREELQGQGTIPEELYNHLSSRLKQVQGTDSNIEEQNRNQVKRRFKVEAWSQESVSNQLTKPKDQHGSQYGQLCAASFPS